MSDTRTREVETTLVPLNAYSYRGHYSKITQLGKMTHLCYWQMCSSNDFKSRSFRLVVLVLNFSERWHDEKARFRSFVYKSLFSGVFYGFAVT
jgi:hypothetical protein